MVLILVVMEYGLRLVSFAFWLPTQGLNPCCNGIWSQTHSVGDGEWTIEAVLILVVMEILCKSDEQSQARLSYAMTQPKFSSEIWSQTSNSKYGKSTEESLNPCCNGIWSQT